MYNFYFLSIRNGREKKKKTMNFFFKNAMMCVKFHGLHVGRILPPPPLPPPCPVTITEAAVLEAEYCKFIIQTPIKDCDLRWGREVGRKGDRYENPIKAALNVATDDDDDDRDGAETLSLSFSPSFLLLQHVCRKNCKLTALLTQLEQKIQRKRVNKINTKSSSDSRWTPALPCLVCLVDVDFSRLQFCCAFHLKRLELIFEWPTRQAGQPKRGNSRVTWNVFGILHLSRR